MKFFSMLLTGNASKLTSFFSMDFLLMFLPISVIGYTITPKKLKRYFLLVCSICFFCAISGMLVAYLALTVFAMHYFGIWLERIQSQRNAQLKLTEKEQKKAVKQEYLKKQRRVLTFAVLLLIGGLLVIKYSGFFTINVNALFSALHIGLQFEIPHFLMPIGISFFTLQAVSYLVDVYHEVIPADDNLPRLALFLSFFPQIVEGPICRYQQTAEQLWNAGPIRYENLTRGIQRILYGMMKKVVIADRLNPAIKVVFAEPSGFDGGVIALAAVFYTIQLYCDFSGAMDAVVGIAQIFGITMPENFARPFFSKNISEFWKRWHITLGTWFKDYIFYPVTMSKPMKNLTTSARKKLGNHFGPLLSGAVALFCVWFSNGLWHGADWTYIFFGMYHFVLILIGNMIVPLVRRTNEKLHIKESWPVYRGLQIVRTTILVIFGELFFRAEGMKNGFYMFGKIFTNFTLKEMNEEMLATLGIDTLDLIVVAVCLIVVFVVSLLKEKGVEIRESLAAKPIVLRWAVLYAMIIFIVIFGAYGFGYVPVDPMYADF